MSTITNDAVYAAAVLKVRKLVTFGDATINDAVDDTALQYGLGLTEWSRLAAESVDKLVNVNKK